MGRMPPILGLVSSGEKIVSKSANLRIKTITSKKFDYRCLWTNKERKEKE